MKKHFLPLILGLAGVFAIATAFGTGDEPLDEPEDDGVVLGEEDLAERGEILRNQFRRMTPGDGPLVQDVGSWPAAWEEFGPNWNGAAVEREYGAWVVPVEVEQTNGATVIRDGTGLELWRGTTDFTRPESADVVLTGGLVAEEDWAVFEAVRGAVEEMTAEASRSDEPRDTPPDPETGLRFTSHEWTADNTFRLELAYEEDTNVDLFVYAVDHTSVSVETIWTNDENMVITDTTTVWYPVGEPFDGRDSAWEYLDTVAIDNGEAEYEDSGFPDNLGRARFYAAAVVEDTDGDGLSDGFEDFVTHTDADNDDSDGDGLGDGFEFLDSHTDPNDNDSDHDGVDDPTELAAGTNPLGSNVWWVTTTTNYIHEWVGLGTEIPSMPQQITNYWIAATNRPTTNSVVHDVKVTGYIDDILTIDGDTHVVGGWDNGPTNFTAQSILAQTTNAQSGRVNLVLWDLPAAGYTNENEVKIGYSQENPFRVEWEWKVPIDIRMEPIWTSTNHPLDNPSGVILGSNAWFHVDVLPEGVVPEDKILWSAQDNKLTFATTNRGSRVEVQGMASGETELTVSIEDTEGDFGLSPFNVKVMPLTVVTAKVGIVVGTNGEWAVQASHAAELVAAANDILVQAGFAIEINGPILAIPDVAHGHYANFSAHLTESVALLDTLSQPGGIEIYFVNTIESSERYETLGLDSDFGMLVASNATSTTLAHEFCHRGGLEDIFIAHPEDTENPEFKVDETIDNTKMPMDWGRYNTNNEEPLPQAEIIPRLLMHGFNTECTADIPMDAVYGTWYCWNDDVRIWSKSLAPVGQGDLVEPPQHQ